MKEWHEIFSLPEKRKWILWVAGAWLSILLGPFVWFGENWGMIFYIIALPFSAVLKTLYEDFGFLPYIIIVALSEVGWGLLIIMLIYNAKQVYCANRDKP